ncbi:MAG: PHP domain-containing protein [Bradymonadaceae bacterium]|nr:PHP domain-containing protein [Lujinxingiaceae bacterium]
MSKNTQTPNLIAEIHTHSTVSDGALSPQRLAELMQRCGVGLWALTDHDTSEGCIEAAAAAKERGIRFISGIEISAKSRGQSIHVLGYGFDPNHRAMIAYSEHMNAARADRMEAMRRRICELGFEIHPEEVTSFSERGNLGRPHIARAMHARGYVDSVQQAFDLYLADGRPAYVGMDWIGVDDAIDLLHDAGGIVILAHPARYDIGGQLAGWVERGLEGLEVRHPAHELLDEARLIARCDRFGLLKTASSDFHGTEAPLEELPGICGRVNFPVAWQEAFLAALRY